MFHDPTPSTPAPVIDSEFYTAQQLAELLDCDKETAQELIRAGDLPGIKFGKGWIIPRQALIERVNEMAKAEAAKRRAARTSSQAAAIELGKKAVKAAAAVASPTLPSSESKPKRGQRRAPPDLTAALVGAGLA